MLNPSEQDSIKTVKTLFDGESAPDGAADLDSGAFTQGTNASVAKTLDGKLTYPPPANSTGTDSPDPATETGNVTPTTDEPTTDEPTTDEPTTDEPTTDDVNTLRVGPGHPFGSLGDAVAASKAGDTILLEAGIYESDYSTIGHALTIKGVNGLAHLKAVDPIPNGKAILVVKADVTVENIMFTDARVPDHNGAGIRHESGDLVILDSIFENNENGILSAPNATASVTIQDSEFIGNGHGDGRSHGIYVNQIASLDVAGSTFRDTNVGHHIKSRAQETTVRDSTIDDGQGDASYSVDLPNGGRAILENNTLTQTSLSENPAMVAYGAEGNLHSQNSLLVKDNLFIDNHANGKGVYNHTDTAVILQGNTFQDVETEVVGPHEFIDGGAANPASNDGAITAEDTANDSLADDDSDDESGVDDDAASDALGNDEAVNDDFADDDDDSLADDDSDDESGVDDDAANDELGSDEAANDDLANDDLADNGSAGTADDLIDVPHKGFLPRDLFTYTTKNGDHVTRGDFSDMFADAHDGRDGVGPDGDVGDWWFGVC